MNPVHPLVHVHPVPLLVPVPAPALGRVVHVTFTNGRGQVVTRPGSIVRTWPNPDPNVCAPADYVNVQVLLDGANDGEGVMNWFTSVAFDPTGQRLPSWRWPDGAVAGAGFVNVTELAGTLYTRYCASVGGVAFNGDPLPTWAAFAADPAKVKQANAWLESARDAVAKLLRA